MHWRYLSNIQAFRYFAWIWCDFWWVLCHKTSIGEMYAGPTSIPYTKVTSIHYQTLSKNDTTWKIEVNNLSVWSLLGLLLFSWTSVMILATIMKSFTTGVSRTFWWHAPPALCGWITGKGNLSRAEKIFYKENSRKIFWRQNFNYGLILVRALTTHSMGVAGQWKKWYIASDRKSTSKKWWWSYVLRV